MAVVMSGAEYRRFLASDWGPDAMWEDYVLIIDGIRVTEDCEDENALIGDGSVVELSGGVIYSDQRDIRDATTFDAEKFAHKWLKGQKSTTLVIEVDNAHLESLRAIVAGVPTAQVRK